MSRATTNPGGSADRPPDQQPMIVLEGVSKTYPGHLTPAVAEVDLAVARGSIVMLVGPSGCGKTTTLKMMNRLIEPTTGRILLDGEDVTKVNADQLRRRIGYVIQQVGLFPHFTVGQNIGVVPRMLGWERRRIRQRIDELLELVGLPPGEFRDRYPRQLSGGQQQRVGVARALAADPPVMLMDEPFGAIDPITRERLHDQFLEIQRTVRKTICFVTHDLQEAIKLGDHIAIFAAGGRIAQYDTPEMILSRPANDFVREFVGSGAAVRRLHLIALSTLALDKIATGSSATAGAHPVIEVDGSGRPVAWIRVPGVDGSPALATVPLSGSVYDAVDAMLDAHSSAVAVVDGDGRAVGALRWEALVGELQMRGRHR